MHYLHKIEGFEQELKKLSDHSALQEFIYEGLLEPSDAPVTKHFRLSNYGRAHGIYIIRQAKTKEVLYIGKGGTLKANGEFKKQGIFNRLKARRGSQSSKQVFFDIYTERGPLLFQYIVLDQKLTPGLVEALLLQAFFNEYGRLPYKNSAW